MQGDAVSREQDRIFIRNFIGIIAALAALAIVFAVIAAALYEGNVEGQQALAKARAMRHLEPVGEVRLTGDPMPAVAQVEQAGGGEPRSGQEVAQAVCMACHSGGFMNAPAVGEKEAWASRIEAGLATLVEHAATGFGNMPPQSAAASEEEIREAILWMVEEQTGLTVPK